MTALSTTTLSNIILIGMPGSGKSTVGVQLAKQLNLNFVDTDLLIQNQQGQQLQDIVDQKGYLELREIEKNILLGLNVQNTLISTGGSAVYSEDAMNHLKSSGITVFLDVELENLEHRVSDEGTRGIARAPEHSFKDVFNERTPLYKKYADIFYPNNTEPDIADLALAISHYRNKVGIP